VRVEIIPAGGEDLAQALDVGRLVVRASLQDALAEPVHRAPQCLGEQLLFTAEVVVDGRRGDPGGLGDILDPGLHIPIAGKHCCRSLDDLLAPGWPVSGTLAFGGGHDTTLLTG
jgi:hypothetical protein